jgi:hypothetical protein
MTRFLQQAARAATIDTRRPTAARPSPSLQTPGNQAHLRRLQAKLRVGRVDDPLEREADAAADRVMRTADPQVSLSAAPMLSRKCAACEKDEHALRRSAMGPTSEGEAAPPIVDAVLASPGRALDPGTKDFMASRFGADFSGVRIHTDMQASQSAAAVDARAFTVGRHIVFGAGRYVPASATGRHLLAHELAHTIQQGATPQLRRAPRDDAHGSTLPYHEATELAECMRIIGDAEACREQVLGEKPAPRCARSYTIPDDVHAAIGVAWGKSKHGEADVVEQGGRIVSDRTGKRQIRTGSGGGGSISLPAEKAGDTTLGTFHTHPYSASEGSTLGVAFSGGDITNFVAGRQGSTKYIGAGSCYFVLDTLSFVDRDGCKSVDLTKRWNDSFAAAGGTFQEKVETAVQSTITGCGLCFYKVCRPSDASPVPKVATQV